MSSRRLDDLAPPFRPLAIEFLARATEAGIPLVLIETLRTANEQAELLLAGRSWTIASKHLRGYAIDVCPYERYQLHGPDKLAWEAADPVWLRLGTVAEGLGLVWGGRWKVRDMGHVELATGLIPGGWPPADLPSHDLGTQT